MTPRVGPAAEPPKPQQLPTFTFAERNLIRSRVTEAFCRCHDIPRHCMNPDGTPSRSLDAVQLKVEIENAEFEALTAKVLPSDPKNSKKLESLKNRHDATLAQLAAEELELKGPPTSDAPPEGNSTSGYDAGQQ